MQGIIHPTVAQIIWSDECKFSLSPYRFCYFPDNERYQKDHKCSWDCNRDPLDPPSFREKVYILDFAGGGAVHLIGS